MTPSLPPPLPPPATPADERRNKRTTTVVITVAAVAALFGMAVIGLRVLGLLIPYNVPTGAMSPAIEPGDRILMEGFTYLARKPARGDIIVFKTDDIPALASRTTYVMRLVGLPNDRLRLSDGVLYVNDQPLSLHNRMGPIRYLAVPGIRYLSGDTEAIVPDGHYFVLGDQSARSADSRYWGFVPDKSVRGRAAFCYWPPSHIRSIR
jgi:signal peptidase I